MKLPKLALANYQFVLILVFLAVLLGVRSLLNMPRSEDPDLSLPIYTVVAVYPGTSPEDMEELVADPIEEAIDELDEISLIRSTIEEGLLIVQVEGDPDVDIDEQYDEVAAAVNNLRSELPEGIFSLEVDRFSPLDVAILQLAVVSETGDFVQLNEVAEDLKTKLRRVNGVRAVNLSAEREEEIRVSLDWEQLGRYHIPMQQVIGVLKGNNANIPGGELVGSGQAFNLKTSGAYRDLQALRRTVVQAGNGQVVRLEDIAEVEMRTKDPRWLGRFNGESAVFLTVTQKKGNNILDLSKRLEEASNEFAAKVPTGVRVETAFEQGPAVKGRVNGFFSSLVQGILLVGVIIFLFLGFRPSLVIMTIIPISILIAVGTLDLGGFALQQISIAGLVIALGLLVDNGIVVLENVMRYRSEGHSIYEAAVKGTAEVGIAIVSSTVTTLLAFFPLTQLGGGTGEFLKTLPLIVIFALVASLVLALTVTPILAGRFLKNKSQGKSWFLRQVDRFIENAYQPLLDFALRRPLVIMGVCFAALVGSFALFPQVGVSFFPTADKPVLLIDIDAPKGNNLNKTDEAVRFVEGVLKETDFVASFSSNTGHDNPQIYYNRVPRQFQRYHGQVLVNFKNWDPVAFYTELGRLRERFASYPDANIVFTELKNGPPFEAPIEIKLIGNSMDTLRNLSAEVTELIRGTEGTLNTENPLARGKTDLRVAVDRDRAGLLGVSLADLDLTVRAALTGLEVDEVQLGDGEDYPLNLRLPLEGKPGIGDLERVYLTAQSGASLPLRQVAQLEFERSVHKIDHYQLERTATVTADVYDSDKTAQITEVVIAKLEEVDFPEGYRYYVAGEYETQQSSFGDLGVSLFLALLAIFAVLVLQFRSVKQPLIVFSAIPFAFIGSIVFLYLTGWSFSFFAFVGFTSLVGIVVNNSIILVDFSNQLMLQGKSRREAIEQAAKTRFTPILLTTLTTVLGLLPLTLGNTSLWSPLGWTIIGGMVVSTFLVLLVVPILYQWLTAERVEVG